ncbi:MAG TPA: histidine kinase [Bryobacteraceae bacterium]|nr:histidine kinase [Bryobacteraceae bacterium]
MAEQYPDGSKFSGRLVLIVGFGSLLAIMALSGIDALRVLRQFRQRDDQIRRQFLFRNRILNNIRSEVYLSGTLVRDYLLDPDPIRATAFGASLAGVRTQMDTDLGAYARQLGPADEQQFDALHADLNQYWTVLEPVLKWDAERRRTDGYAFLRDEVYRRRTAMLEVAGRIADFNERQLNEGNERASDLLTNFQTRSSVTIFAALALGLGMAIFTGRRILRLEARAHSRFLEVAAAKEQLANLSARLVEAQETERRSISRELHDEVGQSLSAVLVELRNLQAGLGTRPEQQTRHQAETIKGLVEGTVGVVRSMALLLRPSMLDDLGLIPALKWQAREVSKRTNMDVTVSTELESDQLPDEYKTCIYRIVQEALHNSSRHAAATTVRVRVQQRPESLVLSIQDDGRGFDVAQSKGMGLLGIEERAAQLGGATHIQTGVGIGTLLTIELPFGKHAAQSST